MEFMLSQTQDIAGQQSFVWDFFIGVGGGEGAQIPSQGTFGIYWFSVEVRPL